MDYDLGNKVKKIYSENKKDKGFLNEIYDVAKGLAKKPTIYASALLLFGAACAQNLNVFGIRVHTHYVRNQYSGKIEPSKKPPFDLGLAGVPFVAGAAIKYCADAQDDGGSSGPEWTEEGGDDIDSE